MIFFHVYTLIFAYISNHCFISSNLHSWYTCLEQSTSYILTNDHLKADEWFDDIKRSTKLWVIAWTQNNTSQFPQFISLSQFENLMINSYIFKLITNRCRVLSSLCAWQDKIKICLILTLNIIICGIYFSFKHWFLFGVKWTFFRHFPISVNRRTDIGQSIYRYQ